MLLIVQYYFVLFFYYIFKRIPLIKFIAPFFFYELVSSLLRIFDRGCVKLKFRLYRKWLLPSLFKSTISHIIAFLYLSLQCSRELSIFPKTKQTVKCDFPRFLDAALSNNIMLFFFLSHLLRYDVFNIDTFKHG